MRTNNLVISFIAFLTVSAVNAQVPSIQVLESGKRVSIRGLSAVTDDVVWASGTGGSVARSLDGKTFTWITVPGYEKRDFRDIEAFDANTAVVAAIGEPAVILKTKDGGKTWLKVFEDNTPGMFLDAMDFSDDGTGVVIGDPIDKKLYVAQTTDYGDHWQRFGPDKMLAIPELYPGEAFFASSGTNIKLANYNNWAPVLFVSGGTRANLWMGFSSKDSLPIMQGGESTGANSIAVDYPNKKAVIVGGDFAKDTISSNNCVLVSFANKSLTHPATPPHGFRSCVVYVTDKKLVTCGTSGVDVSWDGGMNWQLIVRDSYHVCHKAKRGTAVFLAGNNGRISKLAGI